MGKLLQNYKLLEYKIYGIILKHTTDNLSKNIQKTPFFGNKKMIKIITNYHLQKTPFFKVT